MTVTLIQMDNEYFAKWQQLSCESYGKAKAEAGHWPEEKSQKMAEAEYLRLVPDGLKTTHHHFLIVVTEKVQVGSIWVAIGLNSHPQGSAYIFDIQIDQELRGQGLGRKAMKALEAYCKVRGVEFLDLNVFAANQVAHDLYVSLGFETITRQMRKKL